MPRRLALLALGIGLLIGLLPGFTHWFTGPGPADLRISAYGEIGEPVFLQVTGTPRIADRGIRVLKEGKGEKIKAGGQVLFQATSFIYKNGYRLVENEYSRIYAGVAEAESLGKVAPALIEQKIGSRIEIVEVPENENKAEIVIIDILPLHIAGENKNSGAAGLPTVTEDAAGVPHLQGGDAHTFRTAVLKAGSGVQLHKKSRIYANYVRTDAQGKVLENTWENPAPAYLELEKLFTGLQSGLINERVGSRILLTIPAAQSRGDKDIYMVVDILAEVANREAAGVEK